MLTGGRGILAALAGLALAGASPPTDEREHRQAGEQVGPPATPTPDYTPHPGYQPDPCYQDKNHDAADLCAQWRAAIAAEEASHTAWWGNWISLVGAVLSFASVVLVVFALKQGRTANRLNMKEAGRNTRRTIAQSKETAAALGHAEASVKAMLRQNELAEIAQQPWLVLDIIEIEYCHIASEGELSIGIKWEVENIGDVPAVSAAWYVEAFVDDTVDQAEIERRRLAVTANALNAVRGNLQIFNLARGQPMEWRAGANISKAQIEAFAARFPSDAYVFPTIVCAVVYKSPASGRWLVSDCSWMIRRTNEAGAILGLKVSDLPYPPQTLGFADSVSFTPRIGEPIEVGATKG